MLLHRFENPRDVIRAGYAALSIALPFNFVSTHYLSARFGTDGLDAVSGLLFGVAFGLLGLGVWRLSRSRSHDETRPCA